MFLNVRLPKSTYVSISNPNLSRGADQYINYIYISKSWKP